MRDHQIIVRIRSDTGFQPSREALRSAITDGVAAWGGGFDLVSLSPIPRDRLVKKRKPPVRRDYPLLSYIEAQK